MLEPESVSTTTDQEIECLIVSDNVNELIITERNKEVKQIETDLSHISAAQQMLFKIAKEQGEQIDSVANNLESSTSLTQAANQALIECEKATARRRKRNAILSVVGATVVIGVATATTLSVMKTQNKL